DYMEAVYEHHFDHAPAEPTEKARQVRRLFARKEKELMEPLLGFMNDHPRVRIIGKSHSNERAPTVSFTVSDQSSQGLASRLGEEGIGVGAGHCYAYRLIEALGIDIDDGVVRTSMVHYTSSEEVDRLIRVLDRLLG
ncbi:MAG: aminotransferase class V-fold PLP-dependent enzyme, partial [Gammaproteobacteria bacterium]|nr:aminotransferase class V-fold PLP-dependent enzyme [Gammaproteobacteria bacterium]